MKAAVFVGKGVIRVEDRVLSELTPDEVVVQVAACGICGTDQHIFHGKPGSASVTPPRILGHELAGQVTKTGANVSTLRPGDRVTIDPNIYCGSCQYCREGRMHLCNHLEAIGVTRDGGMAEYVTVPAKNCFRLPEKLTFEEGALIEPLGCCLHGISQLNIRPGSASIVIGGGYIGLLMVQLLNLYGVNPIVVSELDVSKHAVALELGANAVCSTTVDNLAKIAADQPNGGFDLVIECVGRTESMQTAVDVAAKGGQVLLFGVADPKTSIALRPFDVFSKELQIKGSFINPYTHEMAISLVEQGKVDVLRAISHRFSLEQVPDAMASYATLKVTKGIVSLA